MDWPDLAPWIAVIISLVALTIAGRRELAKNSSVVRVQVSNGHATFTNHGPGKAFMIGATLVTKTSATPLELIGNLDIGEVGDIRITVPSPGGWLIWQWSAGSGRYRTRRHWIPGEREQAQHDRLTYGDGWPPILAATLAESAAHRRRKVLQAYWKARAADWFY